MPQTKVPKVPVSTFPVAETDAYATGQVLSDYPDLLIAAFRLQETCAVGALNSHPHVQSAYVESGLFPFTVYGKERGNGTGDCVAIPSGLTHGFVSMERGIMVDGFTPRCDDCL